MDRLQTVTAVLSASLTPAQVVEVVVEHLVAALDARAGVVALLTEDNAELEVIRGTGYTQAVLERWHRFPVKASLPLSDVVREGVPSFLENRRAFARRYPALSADLSLREAASAGLPLVFQGRVIGGLYLTFHQVRTFTDEDKVFLSVVAGQCAQALERARLYEAEHKARENAETAQRRMTFLAEASAVLSRSLDYEATLSSLTRLTVPGLADWCTVDIASADGQVERLAVAHVEPARMEWARDLQRRYPPDPDAPHGVPNVLRTGRAEIYPEVTEEMLAAGARDAEHLALLREIGIASLMFVPLLARGHILGVMTFVASRESSRRYDDADLAMAQELARRAALAVDNARLYQEAQQAGQALGKYEDIFKLTEQGIAVNSASSRVIEMINPAFARLYGCLAVEEMLGKPIIEVYAPECRAEAQENIRLAHEQGHHVFESRHLRKDGTVFPVSVDITAVKDAAGQALYRVVNVTDITERKAAEALLAGQNRLLERIATGAPLMEVLNALTALIEEQAPDVVCSVLLLDADGRHLRLGAAPRLPPAYSEALRRGFAIGPNVGSCGAAAYRREQVVVTDIATDPKWAHIRDLPLAYGLRACWSTPILGPGNHVLGTFGVFYHEPRGPGAREQELVTVAVHLARIAIERDRVETSRRILIRDMLASLTDGRLRLCLAPGDLPTPLAPLYPPLALTPEALHVLRQRISLVAQEARFPVERLEELVTGVDEAASNSLKHARGGRASVRGDRAAGILQIWIEDEGEGIAETALHRAVLERGYSTANTLGHGYWLILNTCDRIYLCTGLTGTTVVLEQGRAVPEPRWTRAS